MRVVSLLPSATEILFALGFDREIVGVSHECDYPPRARTKTIVIHSRIDKNAGPLEIDRQVREYIARGESVYAVDAEALQALAPDLIVTQDLCHVCAASPEDLASALARFDSRPEVLCLNPQDLGDVWRDILWVGEEAGRGWQAEKLLQDIGERLGALELQVQHAMDKSREGPRVAFLEWLQPVYVGDVAEAILRCVEDPATAGKTYELGGPGVFTFAELLRRTLQEIGRHRLLLPLPFGIARVQAAVMEWLPVPPLTRDQLKLLERDNVVSPGALTLADLGIQAQGLDAILPTYLARYRPGGRIGRRANAH